MNAKKTHVLNSLDIKCICTLTEHRTVELSLIRTGKWRTAVRKDKESTAGENEIFGDRDTFSCMLFAVSGLCKAAGC